MELGCHVFCAFIDFTKAFDRVNYWKLFNKLLGDMEFYNYGVVGYYHFAIHIRKFVVRWHNTISESFGNKMPLHKEEYCQIIYSHKIFLIFV